MTREVTLVGGFGDGRVVRPDDSARRYLAAGYETPDATSRELVVYTAERIAFVVPEHLEQFVRAALGELDLERRELVDIPTGRRSVRLEAEVWSIEQRFDAIRVALSLADNALQPLSFLEPGDRLPETIERGARERLEHLAELMSPGHGA